MTARRAVVIALAVASLAIAPGARAYRTASDSASSGFTGRVAWTTFPVPYVINSAASDDLTLAQVTPAVDAAFGAWTQPSCSALTVVDNGSTATRARSGDGTNVIVWEESGWGSLGFPSSAIGVTNTEYGTSGGGAWHITGSDMHLNGVNFTWVIEGGAAGGSRVDVQSIVAHEGGHFLGMLHPCEVGGFDGAPDCTLPDPATAPTMFPAYTGMGQRSLEADDVDGICYLYPKPGCETTRCAAGETCDGAGGCTSSSGTDAGMPGTDAGTPGVDGGTPPRDGGMVVGGGRRGGCCAVAGAQRDGRAALLALAALGACVVLAAGRRRKRA